jgi:hypothetical protein
MNTTRIAPPAERLTARTASGRRTTASMPESIKAEFTAALGGTAQFREQFHLAMREVEPVPGISRSMGVRLRLAEVINQRKQTPQE